LDFINIELGDSQQEPICSIWLKDYYYQTEISKVAS